MAFLLPRNIPSHSKVPQRLQAVARAFRDHAPDATTVWLRRTVEGQHYLEVLDPTAGIMLLHAPALSPASRQRRQGGRAPDGAIDIPEEITSRATTLANRVSSDAVEDLSVRLVLAFPGHDSVEIEGLSASTDIRPILTAADLTKERLQPAIHRIFGGARQHPLNDQEQSAARAVVNPNVILPQPRQPQLPLGRDPHLDNAGAVRAMDRRQERFAENCLGFGYRRLRGVAGSGKTIVLLARARYLVERMPNWRVLILCYNAALAETLEILTNPFSGIDVDNIDRLAVRSVKPKGTPNWDTLADEARPIVEKLPDSRKYHAVLVDEAQDFSHSQLDLAWELLKPSKSQFVVAYDSAQDVRFRRGAYWNPPEQSAKGRTTVFRDNYRNTREILEFAMTFLSGTSDWRLTIEQSDELDINPDMLITPTTAHRNGPKPRLIGCRDFREEANQIAQVVSDWHETGVPVSDIVVLLGTIKMEDYVRQAFAVRKIPYFHAERGQDRRRAVHVHDMVRCVTLTPIKGLEFSRVAIGAVNDVYVRDVDPSVKVRARKHHLYAAMTRATDELVITVSGRGPIGEALRAADI